MTEQTQELIYGLIDDNGVLINAVVALENDTVTLDAIAAESNAVAYHLLNPNLYLINVGQMYWTGTHWDLLSNKQ